MREHLFYKMKTLLRLVFEVNCDAKELYFLKLYIPHEF